MFLRIAKSKHNPINGGFYIDIQYAADPIDIIISDIMPSINRWLRCAIHPRVKFLHLLFNFLNGGSSNPRDHLPHVPSGVYRCKNLLVLRFRCFSVKSFPFTNVVEFPQLKTLHLEDIYFKIHSIFTQLLAGCPVLEDFKAANVFVEEKAKDPQVSVSLNLTCLIRADITNCCFCFPIKALLNLQFLRIQLSPQMYTNYHDFPTFHNLTHLVINNISDLVVQVLHHCPKLQNLDLYQKTQSESDNGEHASWVVPKSAPECLSSYLRTCTIQDFALQDLHHDIMLARYILNNAGLLKTMTIWSHKEQHEKIQIELPSCPKASATCRLSVYEIP